MGIKRKLLDIAEKLTGTRIMRPKGVGTVFEEVHLQRFFSHFKIDCVFDVGANQGQYVAKLRERVGFQGPIVSFEPIPELARMLREKAKGSTNWYIEELALDSTAGDKTFNIMKSHQFSSLHAPSHDESDIFLQQNKIDRTLTVKTSTLANEYRKYKDKIGFSRPFLKMDTQGNDVAVAQSGEAILPEFFGLQSELAIKRLYEDAESFNDVLAYYASQGFDLSALVPNNEGHFPYLVELDCIMFRKSAEPN